MQRKLAICLTVGALGVVCVDAQSSDQSDPIPQTRISALQQQRIELLEKRVIVFESAADHDLVARKDLIQPRIDLINARLDYARSNIEKRELLSALLGKYDELIEVARAASNAPVPPVQPGRRPELHGLTTASELLRLQSERVRIEIAREMLD